MKNLLDRLGRTQHWLVALISIWLIGTSPWISMRRIVPESATSWDYAHIGLGLALAVLAVTYLLTNLVEGRWRQYFPWATGNLSEVRSDLAGIARAKIPSAGGAGLFPVIQGMLLIVLLATALSGLGWLLADGSRAALAWREWHMIVANVFAWLIAIHVIASALHLLDFVRD